MAATTETAEKRLLYKVLSPVKSDGKTYKVGDAVALGADEATKLADGGIIESKPIKAKADKSKEDSGEDPLSLKVKADTPEGGDQTGTEE